MNKRFTIVSNSYYNTGGHHMVDISAVYDRQQNQMLFTYVNDDGMTVSSYDYIRQELPEDVDTDVFVQYSIDCAEWTTEPDPLNRTMLDLPEDIVDLFSDRLLQFIRHVNDCDHQHSFYVQSQLPNELFTLVNMAYAEYLSNNDLLVETDGYTIIGQAEWLEELDCLLKLEDFDEELIVEEDDEDPAANYDCNGQAAVKLRKELVGMMPSSDSTDEEEQKFYDSKIQVIVNDKLFTFCMTASAYNGLLEFAEEIIDEQ